MFRNILLAACITLFPVNALAENSLTYTHTDEQIKVNIYQQTLCTDYASPPLQKAIRKSITDLQSQLRPEQWLIPPFEEWYKAVVTDLKTGTTKEACWAPVLHREPGMEDVLPPHFDALIEDLEYAYMITISNMILQEGV